MEKRSIIKIISNFVVAGVLVASLSVPAFAAPPLQSGDQGDNQGGSSQQDNNGGQSDDSGNDNGNNQNNNSDQGAGTGQDAGANQGTGQAGTNQGAGMNQNNNVLACAQTYVVQQGDSLSSIAGRFYNNAQDFNTILQATNNAATTGGNFTNISDPNIITPGQTLCIPASGMNANANTGVGMNNAGATTAGMNTGGTGAAQGAIPAAATSGNNANMTAQQAAFLANNTQQGMLIVENMSGSDIIFDLTQPSLGSLWIGPNQQGTFLLTPGQQQFGAHHPTGDFAVAPGTIQVTAGQITRVSCSTNMCQVVPSFQSNQQQQPGQMQQQGQQPGQMQQQGQQNNGDGSGSSDNNNDNSDGANSDDNNGSDTGNNDGSGNGG